MKYVDYLFIGNVWLPCLAAEKSGVWFLRFPAFTFARFSIRVRVALTLSEIKIQSLLVKCYLFSVDMCEWLLCSTAIWSGVHFSASSAFTLAPFSIKFRTKFPLPGKTKWDKHHLKGFEYLFIANTWLPLSAA